MSRKESCSSLRTWRDCRTKYFYRYERLIEKKETGPSSSLLFGTFCHAMAEDLSGLAKVDRLLEEKNKQLTKFPLYMEEIEFQATLAKHVMTEWQYYWNRAALQELGNLKILNSEGEWAFPLSAGFEHVGKRDQYVETTGGKLALYELKTSAVAGEGYKYRLWMDDQIMANTIALRHDGKRVDGVVYDIVHKHKLRLKKNELPTEFMDRIVEDYKTNAAEYFERFWVTEHMPHLGMYASQADQEIREMADAKPRTKNFGACEKFGRMCEYFELCSEADEGNRESLEQFSYQKRENKFSELEEANGNP